MDVACYSSRKHQCLRAFAIREQRMVNVVCTDISRQCCGLSGLFNYNTQQRCMGVFSKCLVFLTVRGEICLVFLPFPQQLNIYVECWGQATSTVARTLGSPGRHQPVYPYPRRIVSRDPKEIISYNMLFILLFICIGPPPLYTHIYTIYLFGFAITKYNTTYPLP